MICHGVAAEVITAAGVLVVIVLGYWVGQYRGIVQGKRIAALPPSVPRAGGDVSRNVEALERVLAEVAFERVPDECRVLGFNIDDLLSSGPLRWYVANWLAARGVLAVDSLTDTEAWDLAGHQGSAIWPDDERYVADSLRAALRHCATGEAE